MTSAFINYFNFSRFLDFFTAPISLVYLINFILIHLDQLWVLFEDINLILCYTAGPKFKCDRIISRKRYKTGVFVYFCTCQNFISKPCFMVDVSVG